MRGPDPDGFIRTETAEDILRSLAPVRSIGGPAITMIGGAPGIGKTGTLRHCHRDMGRAAICVAIARGEGNPCHVAATIPRRLGCCGKDGSDPTSLRSRIGRYIGSGRILPVDEARNLGRRHKASCTKGSGFEWLVAASEERGFDPAFCGDPTLQSIPSAFPQVQSRVRRPVAIKAASNADVAALAGADDIEGQAEAALLTAVAALPGGLRNVANVIAMAAILAGKDRIAGPHLRAATDDPKLQPGAGKGW